MQDWLTQNAPWLFSGVAVAIPLALLQWRRSKKSARKRSKTGNTINQAIHSGRESTNVQIGTIGDGDDIELGERKRD